MSTIPTKGPSPSTRTIARDALVGSPLYESLESAGGMSKLGLRAAALAVRPPFSWWRESLVQSSLIMRRCVPPLAVCLGVFMFGFGFFVLGDITKVLGVSAREPGAVIIGFLREASIWVSGMVIAGVAGSAIASDLGSRKIREELDALAVLGVDQVRSLVVPRVLATTFTGPILGLLGMLAVEIVNIALIPYQYGVARPLEIAATQGSLLSLDIYGALIRYIIIGFFVGTVACYKGLHSSGGTEGVGKAVNQTIVICFFGVFLLDAFFNLAYLSLFPASQVDFKG
jgi:phospholipid/cholesterol/gamma-HCH transport system permease protein